MQNDWLKMENDVYISMIRNTQEISKEDMLASFDPVKKLNMELLSDSEISSASYAKGITRSKFQGIFYSDGKNLLPYASKYDKFWLTPSCVEIVVKELQSIWKEYEYKQGNSDLLHSQFQESSLKPKGKGKAKVGSDHGIGITDARLPLSISRAERITYSSYCNSGEQYLRGLINNQTGYVLGNGNGSYIVMNDGKISVYYGN